MPFLAAIGGRCVHCLAGDVEVFCAATVGEDADRVGVTSAWQRDFSHTHYMLMS